MKKLLLVFAVVLLTAFSVFGQWEVVTQGDELLANYDFRAWGSGFMLDANTGWYVARGGQVIKTTDGGASWTMIRDNDGSGIDWYDVEFVDANVGYASAEAGYIFKTTNGGTSWDMIGDTAHYNANLKFLDVIDANMVYFAGTGATLLKTTNGGTDYVKSSNTFESKALDGGLQFCDANAGVVASTDNGGYTWYTHDGGTTWNLVRINNAALFPYPITKYSVKYVGAGDDSTIVLGTQYKCILVSQNGGKSYSLVGDHVNSMDYNYCVSVIDKNTFVLGGTDAVVKTTDGGASWDTLKVGTAQTIVFIDFIDANTGFFFGEYNQWMKTIDGGDMFTPMLSWPNVYFRGIGATSTTIFTTAFAGGETTTSNDGGVTWDYPTNYLTGAAGNLLKCEFHDNNNGIIVGQNGNLYRTTDGGTNWTFIENPMWVTGKSIETVAYYSADTVFVGGASGYLMRSVDGGLTWSDTQLGTKTFYGILPLSGTTFLACGQSGYLYKGVFQNATTIDDSLFTTGTDDDFNAIVSYSDSVMLVSDEGNIFKAALGNLGALTKIVVDAATDELNDIEFVNSSLVFVAGCGGKIYRSEDTGNTWTAETSPVTDPIYDIIYTKSALIGVTNLGTIIRLDFTLAGDYYIPQGSQVKGFATFTAAVTALNTYSASAPVNFLLDADTLREDSFTFTADVSAAGGVVVKPAPDRNVVLIVAPGASKGNGPQMIGFDKGFITFDGSNNGTDSRNLTITNEVYADVPIGLNTVNADMVVLKNLIIKNLDNGIKTFKYGPITNDVAGIEGFTVENCQIGSAEFPVWRDGIAVWGSDTAPTQGIVLNNEIYAGSRGITTYVVNDCDLSGNTINMLPATSATTYSYVHGIYLTGASGPTTIQGNTINCLEAATVTGTYVMGIAFAGNSEGAGEIISVVNNMINVGATDETHATYGIGFRSANNMGNIQAFYNTILVNDNASTLANYAIGNHTNGTGPVSLDLMNNIIINNHSGNTGSSAIGLIPTTSVLVADYNLLVSNQNFVNFQSTSYADLAAWQTAGQDAHSVSKAVEFVSATDLHLTGTSIGDNYLAGTPLSSVAADIDGNERSSTAPYMGADEGSVALVRVGIATNSSELPAEFSLQQNYPNPFNPTTTIAFDLPKSSWVTLAVYNMLGQQVAILQNGLMEAGYYHFNFEAGNLPSGMYIYRIQAGDFNSVKKMTIMK